MDRWVRLGSLLTFRQQLCQHKKCLETKKPIRAELAHRSAGLPARRRVAVRGSRNLRTSLPVQAAADEDVRAPPERAAAFMDARPPFARFAPPLPRNRFTAF